MNRAPLSYFCGLPHRSHRVFKLGFIRTSFPAHPPHPHIRLNQVYLYASQTSSPYDPPRSEGTYRCEEYGRGTPPLIRPVNASERSPGESAKADWSCGTNRKHTFLNSKHSTPSPCNNTVKSTPRTEMYVRCRYALAARPPAHRPYRSAKSCPERGSASQCQTCC